MKVALLLAFLSLPAFAAQKAAPVASLVGAGTSSHSVTLSWTQSPSSGVTGNNVYRGSVAGGPYVLQFASPTPITTYQDTTVGATQTYFYVMTATCKTCSPAESINSNENKSVVPADAQPQAPTGLASTVQ